MIDYSVYLVTDEPSRYKRNWLENIEAAIAGGVTCVQYRDTESAPAIMLQRTKQLQELLRAHNIPLVINNYPELALQLGADAVHVGQDDTPPAQVRSIVGRGVEIGLSITSLPQVAAIDRRFVDCIGIGPVYDARKTKADAAPEMGLAGLSAIISAAGDIPNCAIGGITLERAAGIAAAGARGLAIVSAISQASDPEAAARGFAKIMETVK